MKKSCNIFTRVDIVGVNNRDLKTFTVDVERSMGWSEKYRPIKNERFRRWNNRRGHDCPVETVRVLGAFLLAKAL